MANFSVFHEGELAVQRRAHVAEPAERNSAMIRDVIPRGAIAFLREQRMAVVGSGSEDGSVWASVIFGPAGFVDAAEDGRSLTIGIPKEVREAGDPAWESLRTGGRVGLLAIDLSNRRRLRVNGSGSWVNAGKLRLSVEEAFGNCPKYIQRRVAAGGRPAAPRSVGAERRGEVLDEGVIEAIQSADTFFIASMHRERGFDVSHRGGRTGFIEVLDAQTLRIPDYAGNNMFNTLGNLAVNPKAGITIPDFERGTQLQLTGGAEIIWDQPDAVNATGGTGRFWIFRADRWVESEMPNGPRFRFVDFSPFNPQPAVR